MASSGFKRDSDGNPRKAPAPRQATRQESHEVRKTKFTPMFEEFRDELDKHHDRRERVIKASRDVTALSKKIIFCLQRVKTLKQPLAKFAADTSAEHLKSITALLATIAPDIQGINRYRYAFSLRGLEELVEALTLSHYLTQQALLPPAGATTALPEGIALTPGDYLNGVMDLFGEMMRFATVMATREGVLHARGGGGVEEGKGDDGEGGDVLAHHQNGGDGDGRRTILTDMHEMASLVETLPTSSKGHRSKVEAMRQSVAKVEKLGYSIAIRGGERPKGWMPDVEEGGRGRSPTPV